MSVEALRKLYDINHQALGMNVEGLSHEESLIQPPGGGNCLNWVAGHIVANRNFVLSLLGEEPIWSEADTAAYKRGSAPIRDGRSAAPFDRILTDFTRSQERVRAGLARLTDADLAREQGKGTLGDTLHFLQFHEAYHVGQAGLLRRIAGKEGAIP
jgi:uncharacterized damage-inducible protein DinB